MVLLEFGGVGLVFVALDAVIESVQHVVVHVAGVLDLDQAGFLFLGTVDLSLGTRNFCVVVSERVTIDVRGGIVYLVCPFEFLFLLGEVDLLLGDTGLELDAGLEQGVAGSGGFGNGHLLLGGQILRGEGDVAHRNLIVKQGLLEGFLEVHHIDLMLFLSLLHVHLELLVLELPFLDGLLVLGSLGLVQEVLVLVQQQLVRGQGVHVGRLRVAVTGVGLQHCSLGLDTRGLGVTQGKQPADVFSLGLPEVEDTDRLHLLNTGSEKTAGSNHNHQ